MLAVGLLVGILLELPKPVVEPGLHGCVSVVDGDRVPGVEVVPVPLVAEGLAPPLLLPLIPPLIPPPVPALPPLEPPPLPPPLPWAKAPVLAASIAAVTTEIIFLCLIDRLLCVWGANACSAAWLHTRRIKRDYRLFADICRNTRGVRALNQASRRSPDSSQPPAQAVATMAAKVATPLTPGRAASACAKPAHSETLANCFVKAARPL